MIQGMIADAVSLAISNMYDYRQNAYNSGWTVDDLDYKICLQVHDAIMAFVRYDHVPFFVDTVIKECMIDNVPIYPAGLDGTPTGAGPYFLGVDTEVCFHWGVVPYPDELNNCGIDPKYAHWRRGKVKINGDIVDGLVQKEAYPKKAWYRGQLVSVDSK